MNIICIQVVDNIKYLAVKAANLESTSYKILNYCSSHVYC